MTFYLCTWYPRTAQAQRISIVSGAASLAGAFGGLLAFEIEKMTGYARFRRSCERHRRRAAGSVDWRGGRGLYARLVTMQHIDWTDDVFSLAPAVPA